MSASEILNLRVYESAFVISTPIYENWTFPCDMYGRLRIVGTAGLSIR